MSSANVKYPPAPLALLLYVQCLIAKLTKLTIFTKMFGFYINHKFCLLLPERFWLGGNDIDSENTWIWSATGQTALFTAWCLPDYQPNNYAFDQHCLAMRKCPQGGGTEFAWFDDGCDMLRYYICELMWIVWGSVDRKQRESNVIKPTCKWVFQPDVDKSLKTAC